MSSDHVLMRVKGLGKCYELYDKPFHRLWQTLTRGKIRFYEEFWALRDISFDLRRGECIGIVGVNGSGKSTLLQLIAGTLAPTTGHISFDGRVTALLELGSGFNPEFTGRENVYMNGTVLGLSKRQIDEKFDDIAAFAGIGEFMDQPVKTYSSGMAVRLAFSVQSQIDTDLLIIDEALAVGDSLFQKRCYERINALKAAGVSMLFVSHEQETVRTLTDRAIFLNAGRLVAIGLPGDVVLQYRRHLNELEAEHFAQRSLPTATTAVEADAGAAPPAAPPPDAVPPGEDDKSFGTGQVAVSSVEVLDENLVPCSYFLPLDRIIIRVVFRPRVTTSNLNVAVRLRNKRGVKIYSWGTLNQDLDRAQHDGNDATLFRATTFHAGVDYPVHFQFDNVLGCDYYEVQACVSHEPQGDYSEQLIHHWVDEAAHFRTGHDHRGYWFGGVADLRMSASWKEASASWTEDTTAWTEGNELR